MYVGKKSGVGEVLKFSRQENRDTDNVSALNIRGGFPSFSTLTVQRIWKGRSSQAEVGTRPTYLAVVSAGCTKKIMQAGSSHSHKES